jgi:hypothetical protein
VSTFITVLGSVGAAILLFGYGMVAASKMSGSGLWYQLVNIIGGATLMINSAYHSAWPSAILNVIWTAVGAVAITRLIASRAERADRAERNATA